jgi:hypothetical protein
LEKNYAILDDCKCEVFVIELFFGYFEVLHDSQQMQRLRAKNTIGNKSTILREPKKKNKIIFVVACLDRF